MMYGVPLRYWLRWFGTLTVFTAIGTVLGCIIAVPSGPLLLSWTVSLGLTFAGMGIGWLWAIHSIDSDA